MWILVIALPKLESYYEELFPGRAGVQALLEALPFSYLYPAFFATCNLAHNVVRYIKKNL